MGEPALQRLDGLDEGVDDADGAADEEGVPDAVGEGLGAVEDLGAGGPHLGDGGGVALALEDQGLGGVDLLEDEGGDDRAGQDGEALGPELVARGDLEPAAVGHVAGEQAGLGAGAGDEAGAGEVHGDALAAEGRGDALQEDAHDAGGVEGGLGGGAGGDDVLDQAADGDEDEDEDDREVEELVEDDGGGAEGDEGEDAEGAAGHDGVVVVGLLAEGEHGGEGAGEAAPVEADADEAGGDQEAEAGPEVAVRGLGLGEVRGHDHEGDGADEEADAGAKAHEVGAADREGRPGDRAAVGREAAERGLDGEEAVAAVLVADDPDDEGEADGEEDLGLAWVALLDEGPDDAGDGLGAGPREVLAEDEELAQGDDHDEADEAGDDREGGHLEQAVGLAGHGLGGEEVGDEAEAAAGGAHGRDDDHLGDGDRELGDEEDGEEEQGGDRGALLDDAEGERQVGVHAAQEHGQDEAGDQGARGDGVRAGGHARTVAGAGAGRSTVDRGHGAASSLQRAR